MKERLDVLLVKRGLAESREKAKAIIMSGIVYVEDQKEDKAGTTFDENAKIEVRGSTLKYVSRGGLKLEKAMTHFGVTLDQKVCMDVGASTGGFTDCMLQNGAVKVFSVDVGHGQLAWKLRNDPRVVCMEKTNIRYVTPEDIGEPVDFSSIDVSFISLTKVLGPVKEILSPVGEVVALIKPQFEAGRKIPLFGINMGHLGYLTQIGHEEDILPAMRDLMEDHYRLESRMMIKGCVISGGKVVMEDIALNDIVLNRMGIDAFRFELAVNGQLFNEYSADGMVVATPTGSTAYNLSAGGPIVAPEAELLVLTPLCPHSLNSRSIVLPPDNHLSLQIQTTGRTKVSLSFDGDTVVDIEPGDTIEIAKSEIETTLIQLKQVPFLENIRNKMKQI